MHRFYGFDKNERCLVSPAIGCHASCTYCYCHPGDTIYGDCHGIIKSITSDRQYIKGKTVISLGCYTECLSQKLLPFSREIIEFFLQEGNPVSIATKMNPRVLTSFVQNKNFYTFISCPTISHWKEFEKGVVAPGIRLSSIPVLKAAGITPVLYIKPYLQETYADIEIFSKICCEFEVEAVVGCRFSNVGRGKKISLIDKFYFEELSEDYDSFLYELSKFTIVYKNSIDAIKK